MSHSFKCGQFDDAYRPKRLQNWQTPRWNPEKPARDPFNFKKTEVIVNEKGHLLPGVNRPDRNPWNNYVGTHDMPTVVTKAIATDIATRPAHCLEYLDKPNPVKPAVNEPTANLKYRAGSSKVVEGPDDPDHSHLYPSVEDYADHEKRIIEASVLAKDYLKYRKLIPKEEAERACRARQLERELWTSRECQRRAEVHQDIQWLKNQRLFPNIVSKDGGYVSKRFQKRQCGEQLPEHDCSKGCRTPVKGVSEGCSNGRGCSPANNCDSAQFGGCSPECEVNKYSKSPLRSTENYQDPITVNGNPEYPQFEDTDKVWRRPQPFLPAVEPSRSEQTDCNPNKVSYRFPRQEDNPNRTTGTGDSKTGRESPKQACEVTCDPLQRNPTPVPLRQANLSAPSTALTLPSAKPPPPTPNVGAQFSLIGDPSQLCQPSAPPQRAPPAPPTALAAAPAASVAAKELKSANLEHQPLADAVREAGFCRLASRGHPNPGIALDCVPAASGIGWRPFDAPGPTNCSKQRVYRPHTAGCGMYNTVAGAAFARAARPATSAPRRRHVSQMELAIGWDTIPDYPEDEPRPPKHVDGSNGSAAPGIFCRVPAPERTPALPTPPRMKTPMNHEPSCEEIKARLAMLQRDRAASAAIEACRRGASDQRRRNSAGGDPRNLEDHIGAGLKASMAATNAARRRLPRRTLPRRGAEQVLEASRINRSCEACAAPNCDEPANVHRLPPAPFKAGKAPVCLSTNSSFNGGGSSGSGWDPAAAKSFNVPRPRHPFTSRGYEITTLAQPFAMDKNGSAGGAYPEHWRLASVYQLSYKPIVSRNKPLTKTVFQ